MLIFQIKFLAFNAHWSEDITTIYFMNRSSFCFTILKRPLVVLLNILQIHLFRRNKIKFSPFAHFRFSIYIYRFSIYGWSFQYIYIFTKYLKITAFQTSPVEKAGRNYADLQMQIYSSTICKHWNDNISLDHFWDFYIGSWGYYIGSCQKAWNTLLHFVLISMVQWKYPGR